MDKYDKMFDIVEHPEKYSDGEIETALRDPEIREIYNTLCDVDSALKEDTGESVRAGVADEMEIEREWNRLDNRRRRAVPWFHVMRRRVAVAGVIALTSVGALALGIGIVNSMKQTAPDVAEKMVARVPVATEPRADRDSTLRIDTVSSKVGTRIYENEPLAKILSDISGYYGLKLEVQNEPSTRLRLYYKWDSTKDAKTVIDQLNNFEKITLSLSDDVLSVK